MKTNNEYLELQQKALEALPKGSAASRVVGNMVILLTTAPDFRADMLATTFDKLRADILPPLKFERNISQQNPINN